MFPLKNLNTASVCFSFLACGFVAHLHSQEPPTEALEPAAAKEVLLGELSEQTEPPGPETVKRPLKEFFVSPKQEADYAFDPASMRFAARAKQGDRWVLVVDGKEQGTFDRIESILISPGGRHVIYSAKRAGQWVKMLDDKEA